MFSQTQKNTRKSFTGNSETLASDFLENIETMFP